MGTQRGGLNKRGAHPCAPSMRSIQPWHTQLTTQRYQREHAALGPLLDLLATEPLQPPGGWPPPGVARRIDLFVIREVGGAIGGVVAEAHKGLAALLPAGGGHALISPLRENIAGWMRHPDPSHAFASEPLGDSSSLSVASVSSSHISSTGRLSASSALGRQQERQQQARDYQCQWLGALPSPLSVSAFAH